MPGTVSLVRPAGTDPGVVPVVTSSLDLGHAASMSRTFGGTTELSLYLPGSSLNSFSMSTNTLPLCGELGAIVAVLLVVIVERDVLR